MKQLLLLSFVVLVSTTAFAQKKKSPKVDLKGEHIEITYGQPSMRGRVIFGDLVPYNKVWRTGANEATEIIFKTDAKFGGKDIKAGTYTLFTIPTKKTWTVILNGQLGQWGAYEYEKHKSKDVLKTEVPVNHTNNSIEKFTIVINDSDVTFEWDKTSVAVPYSAK